MDFPRINGQNRLEGILLGFLLVASISALLRNEPDMASYSAWVLRTADLVPCGRKVKISDQDHEGLRGLFRCCAGSLKGFNIYGLSDLV